MNFNLLLLVFLAFFGVFEVCEGGGLRKNYYRHTCPLAEMIVQKVTWRHVSSNPNLPAKLIRMHFHDCFVRVCM